jgi:gas vesicle protein
MSRREESSFLGLLIGLLSGLGAGVVLGLLFAPRSGQETRERVKEQWRHGVDDTVSAMKTGYETARHKASDVSERLGDTVSQLRSKAGTSVETVRESLKHKAEVIVGALKNTAEDLEATGRKTLVDIAHSNGNPN